jgi:hypothetical protein
VCAQLDLKAISKRSTNKMPFYFYEFWSEELHCKKRQGIKETLTFECNLMDLVKAWAITF